MLNRRLILFILGVPIAMILLCLLLGLSRSKPEEQSEAVKAAEFQEIKIIAVEERPKIAEVKKTERKKAATPKPVKPKEPEKTPSRPVKDLSRKSKNAEIPKAEPKRNPQQKEVTAKSAAVKKTILPPATYQLDRQVVDEGLRLINSSDGSVPIVEASYRRIGFETYLEKMLEMGGELFVGAAEKRRIIARVVMERQGKGRHFQFFGLDTHMDRKLDGMALFRPREITNEPLIREILKRSFKLFGEQDLRVVVLLPLPTEAGILGALAEYLAKQGFHISDLDWVWGQYIEKSPSFSLCIEKGRLRKTRQIVNLNMILQMN